MFGKKKNATKTPEPAYYVGGQKKPKGTVRPPLTTVQQKTPPSPRSHHCNCDCCKKGR